jgi:HK97 gp10 family phage protein
MTVILTPEELAEKLARLQNKMIPGIVKSMEKACLNVEGLAKEYCTPGKSPYYRAPYSDDDNPNRDPVHMRDTIEGKVADVSDNYVAGVVGTPKDYSPYVHEGTSKMQARPFILDAITEKQEETKEILSDGVYEVLRSECV